MALMHGELKITKFQKNAVLPFNFSKTKNENADSKFLGFV